MPKQRRRCTRVTRGQCACCLTIAPYSPSINPDDAAAAGRGGRAGGRHGRQLGPRRRGGRPRNRAWPGSARCCARYSIQQCCIQGGKLLYAAWVGALYKDGCCKGLCRVRIGKMRVYREVQRVRGCCTGLASMVYGCCIQRMRMLNTAWKGSEFSDFTGSV